jgi:hypothetical protein
MTPRLIGDWSGASVEDVLSTFRETEWLDRGSRQIPLDGEDDIEVLLAWLSDGSYDSQALVVGRRRSSGKLFCVEASHCSCNNYDGQWREIETTPEALRLMLKGWGQWSSGAAEFGAEMADLLRDLEAGR